MILERIQRRLRRTVVSTKRMVARGVHPKSSPVPVFVVGSQRSGTTMVMQVFELSAHATVYMESNPKAFGADLMLRKRQRIERLIAESKTEVAVFKPMIELQHAARWPSDYPDLRVAWLVRRYEDVVNSCVRKFASMRETLAKLAEDPQSAGWSGEGLSDHSRQLVRKHYRPDMSLEDAHALFWAIRNAHYFDLGLENQRHVRLFRYEDLVRDPVPNFEALFRFAGCPFDPRLTREVRSDSVGRNARPDLDGAIASLCDEMQARLDAAVAESG